LGRPFCRRRRNPVPAFCLHRLGHRNARPRDIRTGLGPFLQSVSGFFLQNVRVYEAADPNTVFASTMFTPQLRRADASMTKAISPYSSLKTAKSPYCASSRIRLRSPRPFCRTDSHPLFLQETFRGQLGSPRLIPKRRLIGAPRFGAGNRMARRSSTKRIRTMIAIIASSFRGCG
jgi:hypothetical protein